MYMVSSKQKRQMTQEELKGIAEIRTLKNELE